MIRENLSHYLNGISDYAELRVQKNRSTSIQLLKGNLQGNNQESVSGVSARFNQNGRWGFASISTQSEESVKRVLELAHKNATFLGSKFEKQSPFKKYQAEGILDLKTKKEKWSQQQLIDLLKELDGYIVKKYPSLSSRQLFINTLSMEKNLATTQGSRSYSFNPRALVYISLSLEKNGEITDVQKAFGGLGEFEDIVLPLSDYYEEIDKIYETLQKKSEAVFAKAGLQEVVLGPDLAGILAHEAVGHTTEADLVLGGSVAGDLLHKVVASPLITLRDLAQKYNGQYCPMPLLVDDEGVKAEDITIIDQGVLKAFMHNRESAEHFNHEAKGNARGYRFDDEPLIRMRNTMIEPGTSKLEEMIASIDDGYYLVDSSNGQADSTGEFMFGVREGYQVKKGKIVSAIKDTTISGVAFELLKDVTMVSNDMTWTAGGFCGKKQLIPVGMGGPAVKCHINIGGR